MNVEFSSAISSSSVPYGLQAPTEAARLTGRIAQQGDDTGLVPLNGMEIITLAV
jgi:hypothetical protein